MHIIRECAHAQRVSTDVMWQHGRCLHFFASRPTCGAPAQVSDVHYLGRPQVRKGILVSDPFVGTGSVLLAAAHHGAATLGSDIDMRVIRLGKKNKAGQQVPASCCRRKLLVDVI